jgi:hypothetical protein
MKKRRTHVISRTTMLSKMLLRHVRVHGCEGTCRTFDPYEEKQPSRQAFRSQPMQSMEHLALNDRSLKGMNEEPACEY